MDYDVFFILLLIVMWAICVAFIISVTALGWLARKWAQIGGVFEREVAWVRRQWAAA